MRLVGFILLVLIASGPPLAVAGEEEARRQWKEHCDRAEEFLGHREKSVTEEEIRAADGEFAKAVRIARENGLTDLAYQALQNRLTCILALYDYPAALAVSREILEVQIALPGRDGRIARMKTRCDIGYLLVTLASPRAALRILTEAETEALALKDDLHLAQVRLRMTSALSDLGRHVDALGCAEWVISVCRKNGDDRSLAEALNIRGTIHSELGNAEYALACYLEAENVGLDDPEMVFQLQANRAIALAELGSSMKAWKLLLEVRKRFREQGNRPGEATASYWLAHIYAGCGMGEEARKWARRSRECSDGNARIDAWAWLTEADSLVSDGKAAEARKAYREAFDYVKRLGDRDLQCRCHGGLAEVSLAEGKTGEALVHIEKALDYIGHVVKGLPPLTAMRLRGRFDRIMVAAVDAALESGDLAVAFRMMERTRAAVLMSGIGGRDAFSVTRPPAGVSGPVVEAAAAVAAARDGYEQAVATGNREAIRLADRAVTKATVRQQEALETWYRSQPGCVVGESLEPRTLDETQDVMKQGDVLVLYHAAETGVHALVIRKSGARRVDLGELAVVEKATGRVLDSVFAAGEVKGVEELRKLLLTPLKLTRGDRRVMISPSWTLIDVPFELLAPDREISSIPSASSWVALADQDRTRGKRLLALGAPQCAQTQKDLGKAMFRGEVLLTDLPHAREEVKAIRRKGDLCLLGAAASEAAFRKSVGEEKRWRAVHFACHGIARPRPGSSCVALAPGEREDGFLTVLEVLGLRFGADLVTLSACESGQGPTVYGEGLVALPVAFLHAGSRRVIASRWKVDDRATRIFMEEFYRLWNPPGGKSRISAAAALRRARKAVREKGYDHPRHWAGWVLWGLAD